MKKVKNFKVLIPALLLAIASLSGCEKDPTCTKCEERTDTIYVGYDKTDSVMNLLCRDWKLEAFVDPVNESRRILDCEDTYGYVEMSYVLTFSMASDVYAYHGWSCSSTVSGMFAVDVKTSTIVMRGIVSSDLGDTDDGYCYLDKFDNVRFFKVTPDSLMLYSPFFNYNSYLLYKKYQEQ